ncbi:MAG: response regulator [Calditrichaeota bacterium]|nr:MAG: response regulator [Calditrichota bacterium]
MSVTIEDKIHTAEFKKPDGCQDDQTFSAFQVEILNQVSEGLCVCHNIPEYPYVKFTVWNNKMISITGYTMEEINNLGWYQTIYPDPQIREKAISRMNEMRDGNNLTAEEWIITNKETKERTVEITTSVLHSENGQTHVFALINDITQKKIVEKRKKELQAQITRAEKMETVGLLAGGVAHDLNNLLSPVIGYAEYISEQLQDKQLKEHSDRIIKSASEAAEVVQDLLTLARRGRCELVPTEVRNVMYEIISSSWYEQLIEKNKSIKFTSTLVDPDIKILASKTHLKKAFMNLIRNAIDAMPDGGLLNINYTKATKDEIPIKNRADSSNEYIGLIVEDTGVGIAQEHINHVFEPYFSNKSLSSSRGSGLGLSVVYGVLKDHNGSYEITSKPGKGTKFTLYFPITKENFEYVDTTDEVTKTDRKGNILVVDDDSDLRTMTKLLLQNIGYSVDTAENGHQACKKLNEHSFDLVLLDMIMEPEFDGLDTYIALKEIVPHQKTIIVTGFAETDRVKKACELGVKLSLKKPFRKKDLENAINKILSS